MPISFVYLLVIISHDASILKLDDCIKMTKPEATGRVVWWHEVAEQYGFVCKNDICVKGKYKGYADTFDSMSECRSVKNFLTVKPPPTTSP